MLDNLINTERHLVSSSTIALLTVALVSAPYIFPLALAQMLPQEPKDPLQSKNGLSSSSSTTHISYTIEGSSDLIKSKLPLIKKAVIGQLYSAIGIVQKGSNDTSARLNSLIVNEIDNSTARATTLGNTKSFTGIQISNAIDKLTNNLNNSNNTVDTGLRKVIVENEAQCLPSSSSLSDCSLKIRIHQ
jgi:hypothetical protein